VNTGHPWHKGPVVLIDEYREGGTVEGRVLPTGAPFAEALHTQRLNGGVVSHWLIGDGTALYGHLLVTSTQLDRIFGVKRIASTHATVCPIVNAELLQLEVAKQHRRRCQSSVPALIGQRSTSSARPACHRGHLS
jgi:hypothetical protein